MVFSTFVVIIFRSSNCKVEESVLSFSCLLMTILFQTTLLSMSFVFCRHESLAHEHLVKGRWGLGAVTQFSCWVFLLGIFQLVCLGGLWNVSYQATIFIFLCSPQNRGCILLHYSWGLGNELCYLIGKCEIFCAAAVLSSVSQSCLNPTHCTAAELWCSFVF